MTTPLPAPDGVDPDGFATWGTEASEVTSEPGGFVVLDGRTLAPDSARDLARALLAAAHHSEGGAS